MFSLFFLRVFELDIDKKKKAKMHAKQYIDTVMANIQKQLSDEQTFPTKFGMFINNHKIVYMYMR